MDFKAAMHSSRTGAEHQFRKPNSPAKDKGLIYEGSLPAGSPQLSRFLLMHHMQSSPLSSPVGSPSPWTQRTPGSATRSHMYEPNTAWDPKMSGLALVRHQHGSPSSPFRKAMTPVGASPLSTTPMSATPSGISPIYKTPIRSVVANARLYKTPKGSQRDSPSQFQTPQSQQISNPFERAFLERLHKPFTVSPGVFTHTSTPQGGESFHWSIEHIASLNPADIDEMPFNQELTSAIFDKETEERAQMAIDDYFASQLIAPSPWSDEIKKRPPATPVSQTGANHPSGSFCAPELQGSIQGDLPHTNEFAKDVSCQTVLTLPVDFDLQKILGEFFMQQAPEEEALSTSSLRRKLFFQGDVSAPISPVKDSASINSSYVPMSPMKSDVPAWILESPQKTPASVHFSSSPIMPLMRSSTTPRYRRTSSDQDHLSSPELSPITSRGASRPTVNYSLSSVFRDDEEPQPLCSPDVSPIRSSPFALQQKHTPVPLATSLDESDVSTPIASNQQGQSDEFLPLLTDNELKTPENPHHDIANSTMEEEVAAQNKDTNFLLCRDARGFSFSLNGDDSMNDVDYTNQPLSNMTNQDTGYQTGSLQLTNPDTGLHTNLTNQFMSFPFKTETNVDVNCVSLDSVVSQSEDILIDLSATSERNFLIKTDQLHKNNDPQGDEYIVRRAHEALAQANYCSHGYPEIVHGDSHNEDNMNSSDYWEPLEASTPHKTSVKMLQDRHYDNTPSESSVLKMEATKRLGQRSAASQLSPHKLFAGKLIDQDEATRLREETHQPASKVAMEILRRAEDDLAKCGSNFLLTDFQ